MVAISSELTKTKPNITKHTSIDTTMLMLRPQLIFSKLTAETNFDKTLVYEGIWYNGSLVETGNRSCRGIHTHNKEWSWSCLLLAKLAVVLNL